MEKSAKRGKIPQSDWPLIMGRYEAGETLASIARTYDCSPPAISYIVSRSRARQPAGPVEAAPTAAEPQLIKAQSGDEAASAPAEAPEDSAVRGPAPPVVLESRQAAPPPAERPREANGLARNGGGERPAPAVNGAVSRAPVARPQASPQPSGPLNGEHRRTLHLSLGGNGSNGNGHATTAEASAREASRPSAGAAERPSSRDQQSPAYDHRDQPRYGFATPTERHSADLATRGESEAARRKEGGSFIDQELRTRVDGDIAAFLAAFDAALAGDTQESRSALREATDRLLRAGARTRIELERLEARVPLTSRESGRTEPAWRHR